MRSFIICLIILVIMAVFAFLFSNYSPGLSLIPEHSLRRFGSIISANNFIIIPSAIGFAFVTTFIIALISFLRDKFLDILKRKSSS